MKISVTKVNANRVIHRLGLEPGGKVQEYHTANVARRMRKYLPRRNYDSVPKKLDMGTNLKTGKIRVELPYAKYLYYGKVMAGKPKKKTNKDLRYTDSPNALAGPFWDRRLKQNEMPQISRDINEYVRGKK